MVKAQPGESRESRGFLGLVAFLVSGILGGALGVLALLTIPPGGGMSYFYLSPAPLFATVVAMAGGVVGGWFVAIVILSWAPGRFRCPRCGTANKPHAASCEACGLLLG